MSNQIKNLFLQDIDECLHNNPQHNCTGDGEYCVNTNGGFTCQCLASGYYRSNEQCLMGEKK